MEVSGDSGCLDTHQVASHTIDDWLEHCNVWIPVTTVDNSLDTTPALTILPHNDLVENLASHAGDDHGGQHWGPAID